DFLASGLSTWSARRWVSSARRLQGVIKLLIMGEKRGRYRVGTITSSCKKLPAAEITPAVSGYDTYKYTWAAASRSTAKSVRFRTVRFRTDQSRLSAESLFALRRYSSHELLIRSCDVDEGLLVGGIVGLIRHAARLLSTPAPMRRIIDRKWRVHR